MDKIDLLITGVVAALMTTCFFIHTLWSYFCAGVCAAGIFVIIVGTVARRAAHKDPNGEWENLLDNLDKPHPAKGKLAEAAL